MEGSKKGKVCVTGGAGYFASHLIMRLLQHGYSVRATVRSDPKFKEDTTHLKALPNASENLEIFDADLSRPDSFEAAIDGCVGVFHTAHPILFDAEDPESMVIKPALEGMRGILKACMDSKTVKRVVYTSSASAVAFNGQDLKEMDESVWTDVQFCRAQDVPIKSYFISKTLTEKAALEFAEENGVDLVTVAPSSVVGPFLVAHYPGCFATSMALIRGDREQCKVLKQMQFVHIDDLASAHIFLLECEQAKGRYICSSNDTTIHTLAEFLSNRFPEFQMPMEPQKEKLVLSYQGYFGTSSIHCVKPQTNGLDHLIWAHICFLPSSSFFLYSLNWVILMLFDFVSILNEMEKEEPVHLSSKKLLELGFKFKYGLEEMFDGAIECCKRKGFL